MKHDLARSQEMTAPGELAARLEALSRELADLSALLHDGGPFMDWQKAIPPRTAGDRELAEHFRMLMSHRKLRQRHLPADLFGEPAWDILMDLFIAECEGRPVTIGSACVAGNVPTTTAFRCIGRLVDAGLICRTPDLDDHRKTYVRLSRQGKQRLRNWALSLNGRRSA